VARKVQVHLVDDIDGGEADETLTFSLDGTTYEIDLSTANAETLRGSLAQFVGSARRSARVHVVTSNRIRTNGPVKADRAQNQAIRDWAKRNGVELSDRGRIPQAIVERYEVEAGR
jgi:hypothetical protein